MSSPDPRHLVIPVETLNREFDPKLLVALIACKRGWRTTIGSRTLLHERLHRLPPSIYLSKGVRSGSKPIFRLLRKFGHVAVALDEEGLLRWPEDVLLTMMLDPEVFNFPRLLFAWGESNAETWRKFAGYEGAPIIKTGNPRVDMLRPELRDFYADDVARLKAEHGDFVLFSSNFSMVNHFIPNRVRFRVAQHADDTKAEAARDALVAHKATLYTHFREMLPQLAKAIAPATLLVRPHPSENPETWAELFDDVPNVTVLHEGPIAPWLMAARALVQNSCTSAVEAAVLGTPAFAFQPIVSERYDQELSIGLSESHGSAESLIAAICGQMENGADVTLSQEQRDLLGHHISALEGPLSAERILAAIEENRDRLTARRSLWGWLEGLYAHRKRLRSRRKRSASKTNKSSRDYTEHKFGGISREEIAGKIARLRALRPDLPEVEIVEVADSIFELQRREPSR
ncbi:MAG: surface carbohydrate biosynthesis protein [Rhodovibrionaceae bacterium]